MVENSQIESSFAEIRKRNGKKSKFDQNKITNAIHKALMATNKDDRSLAEELTNGVLEKLATQGFSVEKAPSVEDIQDMVESTLIEQGHSEIAKAYILYRHERRKIRDEKMKVLNTETLDTVSKNFDLNCLRVLASRYLLRNNKNEIIESPSSMFERVAILIGIGDLLHDEQILNTSGNIEQNVYDAEEYLSKLDQFNYKFKIGKYYLNQYHFRGLVNGYIDIAKHGKAQIGFKELLTQLAAKKFDQYEEKINNEKRRIFLLKPEYLNVVYDDLEEMMEYKEGSTQYVSESLKRADNIRIYE